MARPGSLLALRDRSAVRSRADTPADSASEAAHPVHRQSAPETTAKIPPSRHGKKAITGYFSPAMSLAMHTAARRNGMSLQDAMADAFNDWLRKMGESPIGN